MTKTPEVIAREIAVEVTNAIHANDCVSTYEVIAGPILRYLPPSANRMERLEAVANAAEPIVFRLNHGLSRICKDDGMKLRQAISALKEGEGA